MQSDQELAKFQSEIGRPTLARVAATIAYSLVFIADFLPGGASVALRIAAIVPGLLAGVWFLFRFTTSSLGYLLINPFANFGLYWRAIWWAFFWPNPGASRKDWLIFGIETTAFVGMMAGPLI